jgi:hypothetical protein
MTHPRIAMIGAGMMGEAMISGLINNGIPANHITASEPRADRRTAMHAQYGITMVASNGEAVAAADVVVFAIKPQMVAGVLPELQGVIPAGAVVLSIMAGITIATLRDGLNHPAVVRAMPNTPAMIGAGISGWTAAPAVSASATSRGCRTPPSAQPGAPSSAAAEAHSSTAENCGRPTPVIIRVVHIAPGPTPTLTIDAPAATRSRVPSAQTTLPAARGMPRSSAATALMASSILIWWPWAVSMTRTSAPARASARALAGTSPLMPTAAAMRSRPPASTAGE